jgi:type II secretory pathway pseudopilin PulG
MHFFCPRRKNDFSSLCPLCLFLLCVNEFFSNAKLEENLPPPEDGGMKRRPLLLLEMMIAFLIMGGAITMLFTGFLDAIRAKTMIRQQKEEILALHRLKLRLSLLFKDAIDVRKTPSDLYYIKHKGGIDPDPDFRLEVESVLQLSNNVLTLDSWPESGAPRREVLGENIKSIELKFFNEKEGKFLPEYPKEKPIMIKVKINDKAIPLFL